MKMKKEMKRRRPDDAVVTHAGVLLLLREYLVDEDLSGEKNRGIVRNCSIGEMKVESSDSSSKNMKWTLESWGMGRRRRNRGCRSLVVNL